MSSMKGGFSTLNRWFGRNKDKSGASNGKLYKSTTQLNQMSMDTSIHINESSQLEFNRITPVPAATSNAPFEQTFRITVLLPKDQLYVTRLGARVPLSKLLSLVCDNKQLDADKYEFRNPVDSSQVYSCESTIGAVGLSEIRLCHKSESYDSFNADSMLKFQRTAAARDSLSSSSDFSCSRHSQSKLTAKTPSPYSSSNSLNSMDSTGMNYTRTPVVPPKVLAPPPRKKRVAPRPPSQLPIPEQTVAQFTTTTTTATTRGVGISSSEPAYAVIVKRPQLCMSTPNLATTPELETEIESTLELDCNGNSAKTPDAADGSHYATLELKSNGSSLPEPTPRKRLLQIKKKAAPAPPPDAAHVASSATADTISLSSTTASMSELTAVTPQPAPRITTPTPTPAPPIATPLATPVVITPPAEAQTTPVSVRSEAVTTPPPSLPGSAAPQLANGSHNVSKVLLNRTPTPEPRSLGSATEDEDNNDAVSKQADSGIGEPMPSVSPSPEPQPQPLGREAENKCHIDSSSDDDEAIKVYNFATSSKSCIKTPELPKPTTLAELSVLTASRNGNEDELSSDEQPSPVNGALVTPNSASELTSLSSWNYAGPISPPPDFSDLNGQAQRGKSNPATPLDEIVDELSTIINQQRLDTLIRQAPEQTQIEAAKPNRLANFTIAAIGNGNSGRSGTNNSSSASPSPSSASPTIMRADSFQAASQTQRSSLSLRLRSSSQLSLNKLETNGNGNGNLQQRRSSSELSIAESPSLQSLELIKNILSNSRKNSLAEQLPVAIGTVDDQLAKPKSSPNSTPATSTPTVAPTAATPVAKPAPIAAARTNPVEEPAMPSSPVKQSPPIASPKPTSKPSSPTLPAPSSPVGTAEPASVPVPVPVTKPLPPTYRYSGPPSINFATWSERPKSQVAIKNEGDYIFGGVTAKTAKTATTPATPATPPKLTIEVASPILRMGIPRKEFHVPITVKPLRDDSTELAFEQNQNKKPLETQEQQLPQERHVQQQQQTQPEPLRETVKPSTLPRPAKSNRYTLPAGVVQVNVTTSSNSLPRPVSTLERKVNANATPTPTEPVAAPFGQNTLRRTGFKERMLAKEQQEKEQALRVRVSVNGGATSTVTHTATHSPTATVTPTPTTTAAAAITVAKPNSPTKNILRRTNKLELKLQTQPETTSTTAMLQVKLRPTSQTVSTSTPTPTPPPPPALPTLAKVKTQRSVQALALTPTSPDPRSQLLDAIRNFKREELNRA